MRIIAGELGGRVLTVPKRQVRPTSERVREAIFNMLRERVPGADVLDLYAGSGALGLEALSRGARHVTFVEQAGGAVAVIRRNAQTLGVEDRVAVHKTDARRFVRTLSEGAFALAFADPPYDTEAAAHVIEAFAACPFSRTLCVEHRVGLKVVGHETRTYGDTAVTLCFAS